MSTVPNATSNEAAYDDWLDITDSRSKTNETTTLIQQSDINDAFDSITLNCFDEYTKDPKASQSESKSTLQPKKEHPYKSKKNKGKGKGKK